MNLLGPTRHSRLNEAAGCVCLLVATAFALALWSYHPLDPSWNTVSAVTQPRNYIGVAGSYTADLLFQAFGLVAYAVPVAIAVLALQWLRSRPIPGPGLRLTGFLLALVTTSAGLCLLTGHRPFGGVVAVGGLIGSLVADLLRAGLNPAGALIATAIGLIIALYLTTSFGLDSLGGLARAPVNAVRGWRERYAVWQMTRTERRMAAAEAKAERRERKRREAVERAEPTPAPEYVPPTPRQIAEQHYFTEEPAPVRHAAPEPEIPIHTLEEWDRSTPAGETEPRVREYGDAEPEMAAETASQPEFTHYAEPATTAYRAEAEAAPYRPVAADHAPWEEAPDSDELDLDEIPEPRQLAPEPIPLHSRPPVPVKPRPDTFEIPPTGMLNEPTGRPAYDSQELKEIAARIKSKFEEFNVQGTVTQINPGPVVTTYEFKPEAGVKLSRITGLTEDLCLGLHAESVRIERIPGKPTVGIEVPNTRSEVISLRQIIESDEFRQSPNAMTIALGKDINGRIKVAALETMPHLLIAGSTGAGKSVMLNSLIMSLLYKSSPNEVRMIMVDPKRVEMGVYEGIPHLLTPVITDPRKATNALRNAVLEMERRLKLLASVGVRNIDQFNKKVREMQGQPGVFGFDRETGEELQPLPYILILIDELADLMMLERANVEETVTRLAQMARAVGMHLVLATQRPSVDVITGLIKANFPARISFRVATRVDSRTILDSMGAEHLLGRGDMLFLPPGSSRLTRVHGAYVSENEINRVVEWWKEQANPEYDASFLAAPPSEDGEAGDGEFSGDEDPMYQDAVRIVVEMGKASTSTLQRRLRLGYGRAARILDMMQRDGIIGAPDGSRPREVLKAPDWIREVEIR